MSALERFADKVECGPEINSCWVWISADNGTGYGSFRFNRKTKLAHRFSYELYKGVIPDGLVIDHLCKNTLCVNPDHLEAVTNKENIMRSEYKEKTHCPHGHEYTKENTYLNGKKKTCRECGRINSVLKRKKWKIKKEGGL